MYRGITYRLTKLPQTSVVQHFKHTAHCTPTVISIHLENWWCDTLTHTALGKPILFMAEAATQKMSNPLTLFAKHSCSARHTHAPPLADIDTTFTIIIHTTSRTHAKWYGIFCMRLLIPSSSFDSSASALKRNEMLRK